MTSWIKSNTTLSGETVNLVPLEKKHFSELEQLAGDKRIWEHYVLDGSDPKTILTALEIAVTEKENGTQFPFVIQQRSDYKIVGSTRFLDIQPLNKKLEIGWTWLHPDHWGSDINRECKLLLLTFCFEQLEASRVQLKTDERNIRSRKAIEKIGAKFEGVIRNDMVRDNGTMRNSAMYSVIDSEWMDVKFMLTNK